MNLDYRGQTALVTGATQGIGRRIAADLAAAGASVILTGTRADHDMLSCVSSSAEDRPHE